MEIPTKVTACEGILKDHRITECRVTLHGEMVKVRIPPQEFQRFFDAALRESIVRNLKYLGFSYVGLDLEGLSTHPSSAGAPPLDRNI